MDPNTVDDRLNKITADLAALSDKVSTPKAKDAWDRLAALSPFVGGVLVAGVGLYFTVTSQTRQIEINEVDLAVKFFPYITATDADTRTQAYSIIQAVGGSLLITKLAPIGGKAAEPALITAQTQARDAATKQTVQNALTSVQTVAAVQGKLGLARDGMLGPQTIEAISKYQGAQGIAVSGKLDAHTLRTLGIDVPAQ